MKMRYGWVWLALIGVAIGCSSYKVSHDYDTGKDLAALRTYDWMSESRDGSAAVPGDVAWDSLIDTRVKKAVDSQLAAKGVRRDPQNPDFLIVYQVSTKDKVRAQSYTFISDKRLVRYEEGTLVLDFVAPNGQDLLWRGAARRTLEGKPTPEKTDRRIRKAVEEILKGFPPG
jgi:hypothetical protein